MPEDELPVTLTRAEWFTVRGILEQAAFRVVAQILFKMATQIDRPPESAPKGLSALDQLLPGNGPDLP